LSYGGPQAAPERTLLLAPTPNPSRGARTVSFALAAAGDVDLAIYSVDGRRVRTLAHGAFAAGNYRFTWEGDDETHRAAAPGLYFAQLVTGGRRYSRTLVHL
jgi:flagellar hook assembly protein FlgD